LYQSEVAGNQYIEKLKQMEQIYREYAHTLKQIEGIKEYFDNDDWEEILSKVDIDFPLNPFDHHWNDLSVDIYTNEGVIDVDEMISNGSERIRDLNDVYENIDDLYEPGSEMNNQEKEFARRQYLKSRSATEQEYSAEVFKAEAENLDEALQKVSDDRKNIAMDDETELRTLQMISIQKELELNMLQSQNELLLKSFELSNQESIDRKNRESYAYDMYLLDKLEVKNTPKYVPDETRDWTVNF